MSCPRSTASTESAAICLRASGCRWVAACPAREDAAIAPRSPFQPITRLWQFEGLSVKHGPLFEPCPPKAKVTRSNRVGCAIFRRSTLQQPPSACCAPLFATLLSYCPAQSMRANVKRFSSPLNRMIVRHASSNRCRVCAHTQLVGEARIRFHGFWDRPLWV